VLMHLRRLLAPRACLRAPPPQVWRVHVHGVQRPHACAHPDQDDRGLAHHT
jgi:hypothetical protein